MKYNHIPYLHQIEHFHSFDECILLIISNPTVFISSKNSPHSQSYRLSKFPSKIQPNVRDQNNNKRGVVANVQNAEMHVQLAHVA